jgi:hypothetical protein
MNKDLVYYLASPYSDPDESVRQARYEEALRCGAILAKNGFILIEPIAMSHDSAKKHKLPTNFEYWQRRNHKFLSLCDGGLLVLQMDGWQQSRGVKDEIEHAKKLGLPVHYTEILKNPKGEALGLRVCVATGYEWIHTFLWE